MVYVTYACRDVLNEAPTEDERAHTVADPRLSAAGPKDRFAVIHFSLGDVHMKLFPQECPKTIENFAVRIMTFIITSLYMTSISVCIYPYCIIDTCS